jgi:hypothetical protein
LSKRQQIKRYTIVLIRFIKTKTREKERERERDKTKSLLICMISLTKNYTANSKVTQLNYGYQFRSQTGQQLTKTKETKKTYFAKKKTNQSIIMSFLFAPQQKQNKKTNAKNAKQFCCKTYKR